MEWSDATSGDPSRYVRLGGLLRRKVVSVLLFGVAIAIFVVTYFLYPRTPPVTVQGGVQRITVVGPVVPSSVDVFEGPDGRGGIRLGVVLRSATKQSDVSSERLVVAVSSAATRGCPPQAIACPPPSGGARTLYYRFAAQTWKSYGATTVEQYEYGVSLAIKDIPEVSANLAQDDQDIATALPPVSVLQYSYRAGQPVPEPSYLETPPVVDYGQRVTNGADYTWQEGTIPVDTQGFDHWSYTSASSAAQALTSTFYVGTNLSVKDWNTTVVFLCGILVGIGGGALVGSIQAAFFERPPRLETPPEGVTDARVEQ